MEKRVKKMLKEQMQLLSKQSKKTKSKKELCALTRELVNLAGAIESQSFYGVSTHHPYVVQLPIADLLGLYVERHKRATEKSQGRKKVLNPDCDSQHQILQKLSHLQNNQQSYHLEDFSQNQ